MVGHAPLEGGILVRAQVPQQLKKAERLFLIAAGSKPIVWLTSWARRP